MALPIYLAMTPWEMEHRELPPRCGWMACHFSPYGQGLSNLPRVLPADSLVIVNDRIPPWGHDPKLMAQQLQEVIDTLSPGAYCWIFSVHTMKKPLRSPKSCPHFPALWL